VESSEKGIPVNNAVVLPSGDYLEARKFVEAIANAIYPVATEGLTGMECVIGKLQPINPSHGQTLPPLLPRDKEETKSIICPMEHGEGKLPRKMPFEEPKYPDFLAIAEGKKLVLSYELTEADKELLQRLLESLPPLRYPAPEAEIAVFMDAFRQHPNRPEWEPELLDAVKISYRESRQKAVFEKHSQALRSAAAAGRVEFFNSEHIPVNGQYLGGYLLNAFILRSRAVEYLTSIGLSVADESRNLIPAVVGDSAEIDPGIFTKSGKRVVRKGYNQHYTDEELDAIDEFLKTPDPTTRKKPTKKEAANRMNVSPPTITRLVKKITERKPNPFNQFSMRSQAERTAKKAKFRE